ncbi:MAG: hypothetical protein WBG48_12020 [Pricia sp.]
MAHPILIRSILIICVTAASFSCSKENNEEVLNTEEKQIIISTDETPESPTTTGEKKEVRYELSGDFTGKLDIMFLSSKDFTPPDQSLGAKIPWETSYSIPENTYAIGGFANGFYGDAKSGESASLKMYYDGRLIETVIRTADHEGITLPLESYHLEYDKPNKTISKANIDREIQYNLLGDFSGTIMIIYKEADGSRTNREISKLPWSHTFKTTEKSTRVSIFGLAYGGIEGETLSYEVSVDGKILIGEIATADEEGGISLYPERSIDFD